MDCPHTQRPATPWRRRAGKRLRAGGGGTTKRRSQANAVLQRELTPLQVAFPAPPFTTPPRRNLWPWMGDSDSHHAGCSDVRRNWRPERTSARRRRGARAGHRVPLNARRIRPPGTDVQASGHDTVSVTTKCPRRLRRTTKRPWRLRGFRPNLERCRRDWRWGRPKPGWAARRTWVGRPQFAPRSAELGRGWAESGRFRRGVPRGAVSTERGLDLQSTETPERRFSCKRPGWNGADMPYCVHPARIWSDAEARNQDGWGFRLPERSRRRSGASRLLPFYQAEARKKGGGRQAVVQPNRQ